MYLGDGTFDYAPQSCYQIFLTRTYVKKINGYYTTSFSLLKNKIQTAYKTLLEEIKKNLINITMVLKLHQKYFIVILKELLLMQ